MSKREFTGKTTGEAISEGLRALGLTISDVHVEVLEEGAKGLFGFFGSKGARVTLTPKDDEDDALGLLGTMSLDDYTARGAHTAPKPPPQAEKPRMQQVEKPERSERTARERAPRPERPASGDAPAFRPAPVQPDVPPVLHDPQTPQGRAQQFLMEATRLMGVPVTVDVQTDPEGNLFAQMTGDTLGILIGRRGETLDALQYLASLQVNKASEGYTRVTLDTENYRAKREDALRRLAARMAARAYKTGRKVSMEPMNPYERRILHASLQDHPYVTTHSEGEEPNRHVVITLKDGEK
ncbi:MAG: Jag N-terminal domain-containing protein [Oscillospiraceae bacterium]|jgi:spoIIIJ-associated protein|nr:Jag N-terminal domain-containing protein [Oscillospiraceae bacterium]